MSSVDGTGGKHFEKDSVYFYSNSTCYIGLRMRRYKQASRGLIKKDVIDDSEKQKYLTVLQLRTI